MACAPLLCLCCGSPCGCCPGLPGLRSSISTRIAYGAMLLFGAVISAILVSSTVSAAFENSFICNNFRTIVVDVDNPIQCSAFFGKFKD